MKSALNSSPISISINASCNAFRYAGSKIIMDTDCPTYTYHNHAVQLVGYGSEGDVDYWILRNSWNTTWGD